MTNAVMNFVNTCNETALAAVDMAVGEAVHFINNTGATPDWAVRAIESKISDPEWKKNYRLSALTTDVVKHATKHLGVPVSLDEQQVDALQQVGAYIRVGGCDENLDHSDGYLTHAQLSDGALKSGHRLLDEFDSTPIDAPEVIPAGATRCIEWDSHDRRIWYVSPVISLRSYQ